MLEALEKLPVDSEPWKTRYPYLALMKATWKNGAARDPATRTAIVRNTFTDCGKEVYVIAKFIVHKPMLVPPGECTPKSP